MVDTVRHYETEILWNVSYHLDLDSAHFTLCLHLYLKNLIE